MIQLKRIYDQPSENDGVRILVDRLWPRGLSKQKAKLDLWLKEVAPSDDLRKWYSHDPNKWEGFKERYFKQLDEKKEYVNQIIKIAENSDVTLLYSANNEKFNNAVALNEYIEHIRSYQE
ncbi:MAG: DUF488 family protein [Methanomethylovorans sp.]|uniref:DUF488 domain-containing protein n=1 Tax=Methanomethylovorans sp. TaxID=2758717 RepID=UPI001BD6CC02|nr:DUF488 family protein [Methanomethylovorans sp.]